MVMELSNLYISFESRKDSPNNMTENDIERRYFKEYLTRQEIEDNQIRVMEILQSPAVFATYDIVNFVIFSGQGYKVPDPDEDCKRYYNPVLEEILDGLDAYEDAILDNCTYSIAPKDFLIFTLENLNSILSSASISRVLITLYKQVNI